MRPPFRRGQVPLKNRDGKAPWSGMESHALPHTAEREPSCPFAGTDLVLALQGRGLCSEGDTMS